jgi:hypothetical protein
MALMSMLNALLIKKYIKDTHCSLTQLQAEITEVDKSDGVEDGGFDTQEMRRLLGLVEAKKAPAAVDTTVGMTLEHCQDCGRRVITQHGYCLYCGGSVGYGPDKI